MHWQIIHNWTFVKTITPTCHWWICILCFAFNCVQFEWCRSWRGDTGHPMPSFVQRSKFGILGWEYPSLISKILETMYEMIVKQWYIFQWEETLGQFCAKFHGSKWYICPSIDEPWNVPLQNGYNFILISSYKWSKFTMYAPKCESGITNIVDKSSNM